MPASGFAVDSSKPLVESKEALIELFVVLAFLVIESASMRAHALVIHEVAQLVVRSLHGLQL